MGRGSKERELELKNKILDEEYKKEFLKQRGLMELRNQYIMLSLAENQVKTGRLYNPNDTIELILLRCNQLKIAILDTANILRRDHNIMDNEMEQVKNEVKAGIKAYTFEMYNE